MPNPPGGTGKVAVPGTKTLSNWTVSFSILREIWGGPRNARVPPVHAGDAEASAVVRVTSVLVPSGPRPLTRF
ncbi:hypothetical protein H920_03881 [Fukomys damarensis]|uniref:Uncharacterized protein n=1 Tax=Fukomys damarensis TaxID=885580 RepID=A0A091DWM5_FUKDA|nr:hypothetical protein H920_03881 [Fukomys damarensis]